MRHRAFFTTLLNWQHAKKLAAFSAAGIAIALIFVGRGWIRSPIPAAEASDGQEIALTESDARRALIEMLESRKTPTFELRNREIKALKAGDHFLLKDENTKGIAGGEWNCDLNAKKFWFAVPIGSCLFRCDGVFELQDNR